MRIINRYILTELFKIFFISAGFLTALLYMDKILYLTELIINRGASLFEVFRMILYISPAFLALTIPISVLVASVATFNQFSADNEWVAMKGNGWSFLDLMKPVLYFSLVAYLFTNIIMIHALPWGNQSFKKLIYDIVQKRASFEIKPNVFNKDFDNLMVLVKKKEKGEILKDIFISDATVSDSPKIIVAEEGVVISNPDLLKIQLQLKNGAIHDLGEKRNNYKLMNFERYDLTLDLPNTERLQKKALVGNRELSIKQLLNKIEGAQLEGRTDYPAQVELSKKLSIPFTCLIFGFFGAPLGIKSSRSGKSGSYAIAAAAIGVYYIGFVSAQNLGSIGKLDPYFSVWIPNIIYLALMIYMVYKMQREIPFKWLNKMGDFFQSLYEFFQNLTSKIGALEAAPSPGASRRLGAEKNLSALTKSGKIKTGKQSNHP